MSLSNELSGVAKISMALDDEEGYTPKNILITGGAGFIGSHVVSRLVANYPQYKVRYPGFRVLWCRVRASSTACICILVWRDTNDDLCIFSLLK